ncbi:cupin domain-containing protein [Zhaonella formicivorans]|uniref:cupin domain-containing protein n=1 Tax=Zhaonella formicivorans TaxID=2528593 RepID=UPI001D12F67D|nr:cupin domain-containing protein [Zhaonella formicivorans]
METLTRNFKISLSEIPARKNHRGILARNIFEEDSARVLNLLLKPGDKIPAHVTPVDIFYYVIKGSGCIEIGQESYMVKENDIVFSPKYIPHGVHAIEEDFEILVVKAPNPDKP